jgi:hypothetical protein
MKRAALIFLVLLAVGGLVVSLDLCKRRQANQALLAENERLATNSEALAMLTAERARLQPKKDLLSAPERLIQERTDRRRDVTELAALRKRVAQTNEAEEQRVEEIRREMKEAVARQTRGEEPPRPYGTTLTQQVQLGETRNAGFTTPEAALETWLWALQRGDKVALKAMHAVPNAASGPIGADSGRQGGTDATDAQIQMEQRYFADASNVVVQEKISKSESNVQFRLSIARSRERAPYEPNGVAVELYPMGKQWQVRGVVGYLGESSPPPARKP